MARYARGEAAALRKFSHASVVAYFESIQSERKCFLVMEIE